MNEANPKIIGLFVIGAFVLVIGSLVLFSSQDLFTPKRMFVAYFQQSVNGLNVGAPVRFRGIPIGEVINIEGIYHPDTGDMIPRLTIEFLPETMENAVVEEGEYTLFPALLASGMRARLKSASLLTGQLYLALDFYPDTEERYLGGRNDRYPEIPTLDSGLDQVIAKLSELPIQELVLRAISALEAIEDVLKNPYIGEALAALPPLLEDADSTVVTLKLLMDREIVNTLREANQTLAVTRDSLVTLTTAINEESLVKLNSTLAEFEATSLLLQERLDNEGPLAHELLATLREIGAAARSMRDLADTLEEHPESLIRGKIRQ